MPELAWLATAQALPEGQHTRIGHECGDGKVLSVGCNEDGWRAHCFRCDYKWFVPRPPESITEKLARLQKAKDADRWIRKSVSMPIGLTNPQDWPMHARLWFYKAGISNVDIEHGIKAVWSEAMQRVVMPVYEDDQVVYWQARDTQWTRETPRAKYINPEVPRDKLPLYRSGTGNVLVLTEDILSAFKVSKAGFLAWALLGTKLNDYNLNEILYSARTLHNGPNLVYVWLDPDQAGQMAARAVTRTLRAYGVDARNVQSERDPKLHSRNEIKEIICGMSQ